jgi:hypothetical protein
MALSATIQRNPKEKSKREVILAKATQIKSRLVIRVPVSSVAALEDPRIPGAMKYVAYVPTKQMPSDLPFFNVRTPDLRAKLYQTVISDLKIKDKPFHLNNRGIIAIADKAKIIKEGNNTSLEIDFSQGDGVLPSDEAGVLDGGRTYKIIQTFAQEAPEQFISLTVQTGIPSGYKTGMATTLNTSAQVKSMSVVNFCGHFDFIKDELKDQPYFDKIYWEEGLKGSNRVSASKIITALSVMNTELYPNRADAAPPSQGYGHESKALKTFKDNIQSFKRMRGIMHDVLLLRDYIEITGPKLYVINGHKKAGHLSFVSKKKTPLTFSGSDASYSVPDGAVFMQLAALRVTIRQWDNQLRWIDGSRKTAQDLYDRLAIRFMTTIDNLIRESHGKETLHSLAKRPSSWVILHNMAQQEYKEMRKE